MAVTKTTTATLLYSSKTALHLVKFIKTAFFVINLRKRSNFTTHACWQIFDRSRKQPRPNCDKLWYSRV